MVRLGRHLLVVLLLLFSNSLSIAKELRVFFNPNILYLADLASMALMELENQTDVTFLEVSQFWMADVDISLGDADHGFGKTLMFTKPKKIILNHKVFWTTGSCSLSNFRIPIKPIIQHEMMHAMDFNHTNDESQLMFGRYHCQLLSEQDIWRLREKYGSPRVDFSSRLSISHCKTGKCYSVDSEEPPEADEAPSRFFTRSRLLVEKRSVNS